MDSFTIAEFDKLYLKIVKNEAYRKDAIATIP